MTTKNDFTEDEWSRVVRAPLVAGMAISLADPGGPIEAAKETTATLKTATNPPSREQLAEWPSTSRPWPSSGATR